MGVYSRGVNGRLHNQEYSPCHYLSPRVSQAFPFGIDTGITMQYAFHVCKLWKEQLLLVD